MAWWLEVFRSEVETNFAFAGPLTSRDLDIWGGREEVEEIAGIVKSRPKYPHKYEMTVLSGVIPLTIGETQTQIEVLHTVPGLDINDPEAASVEHHFMNQSIRVLDPVSLLGTKLHALRNFSDEDRQDLLHLKILVPATRAFLKEAFKSDIEKGLWYSERALTLILKQNNKRAAKRHGLNLLECIPIDWIQDQLKTVNEGNPHLAKLRNFVEIRWKRLND